MVKIESVEELRKIKESNYGFVIILSGDMPVIHTTNCKLIFENDLIKNNKISNYHWFSTYLLAEKELVNIKSCKLCNL
jgi:uncharacterized protein YjfI (DUF2170 family)